MKVHKLWLIPLIMALAFLGTVTIVNARIPEPDNIVYGVMPTLNNVISLKIGEDIITQYSRGDNPNAGEFFILRVPMDSLDPQEAGTARPGNQADVFLGAESVAAITVTVGERGAVQRVLLPTANDDGDTSLNDTDNCPDVPNDDQLDANNDGQGDACDGNSDTDRDGYTDMQEWENFQDGIKDSALNDFNPLVFNAPGETGYIYPQSMLANAITILQILTGSAVECSGCIIDIGNDDIFGMEEGIDALRYAAGL